MECREPLFLPGKKSSPVTQTYRSGRYSPASTPQTPVQSLPSNPTPLPIPKNLVLLAMMEAAECQATVQQISSQENKDCDVSESSGEDDQEAFNVDRIIGSISTMSGPCGTYAVVERKGLVALSGDPRRQDSEESSDEKKDDEGSYREPRELKYGQKLQVVDFQDGVAKLARGQGFVPAAGGRRLAKGKLFFFSMSLNDIFLTEFLQVGEPLDEVCRLEGLLKTVASRGKELQRAADENAVVEASLRKKIKECQQEPPTHPIISDAPPFDDILESPTGRNSPPKTPSTPKARDPNDLSQPILYTPEQHITYEKAASDDNILDVDENGIAVFSAPDTPGFPGSPNSIDNADINHPGMPRYRRVDPPPEFDSLGYGCGTALLGESADVLWGSGLAAVEQAALEATIPTGRRRAGSDNSRSFPIEQTLSHHASASFDGAGINFRTGMSGHRALSTKSSKKFMTPSREIRMMSEHRGIAKARGKHPRDSPGSKSPSYLPTLHD